MKKLLFVLLAISMFACKQNEKRMGTIEIITDTGERFEERMMMPDSIKPGDYYVPQGQQEKFLVID